MLLLDQTLSLFQWNYDSLTFLIIFDDQESVRKSGWSFEQTPPVGDFRCVLLTDPFGVRVRRWRSSKGDHFRHLLASHASLSLGFGYALGRL